MNNTNNSYYISSIKLYQLTYFLNRGGFLSPPLGVFAVYCCIVIEDYWYYWVLMSKFMVLRATQAFETFLFKYYCLYTICYY